MIDRSPAGILATLNQKKYSMKVVILAGGMGTRLSEETDLRPKPMLEIGGRPILWHIMKGFSQYGFNDFVICLGYKGHLIKEYFYHYLLHNSDLTISTEKSSVEYLNRHPEKWNVTLIDTGLSTLTGGRLKRVREYLGNEPFMVTYGDGVSNINLKELIKFHRENGKIATVTAVQPPGRYGVLQLSKDGKSVSTFREKAQEQMGWINGGFFVMEPNALDYIDGDDTALEREPMLRLTKDKQLAAFKHTGYWHAMDTLWDKRELERLFDSGEAPWITWKN